jgi:hypothetical protein
VSLAAVMALGFLLLVSLTVTAGLAAFSKYAAPRIAELLHLISSLVSLAVIALLFAMMFKWLPDAAVDRYDVWLGAVLTAAAVHSNADSLAEYSKFTAPSCRIGRCFPTRMISYRASPIFLYSRNLQYYFADCPCSTKANASAAELGGKFFCT